ncbi:ATP-grasp domain-containing protein [Patescibacteria group bacterium]
MNSNSITVAVSGVGGGVGQSIIKSFNKTNYRIVGLNADPLAVGLYAVSKGYKIPRVNEANYIKRVLEICKSENIKILFPGLDLELLCLSKNSKRFKDIGTTVVVSDPKIIKICDDKLLTASFLSNNNISVPATFKLTNFLNNKTALNYPLIIKPKKGGSRSENVFLIKNKNDLENLFLKTDFKKSKFVVQEYIKGEEYTCGTVNLDGKCHGIIVMKRTLRSGDTNKCFTIKNIKIEKEVLKAVRLLKPFGACNVQLRLKNNKPYIFEINPRCSGTTAARAICGFNEPKMIADYICYKKIPQYNIKKLSIFRYWQELVVENKAIEKLTEKGELTNKSFKNL